MADGADGNRRTKQRKPMSSHYPTKNWNLEDATRAIEFERTSGQTRASMLMLRFPDPEVSKDIVRGYSEFIENVHFQQPSAPR